ncbi:hypothetical protein MKX01_014664 [Papaver californicum]|nr:hypothetical protein MKX01_014664 [Papaver californicum]
MYGVKKLEGIRFGYHGFSDKGIPNMLLSRKVVDNIHLAGGSLLGVSREVPNVGQIVDNLQERGINMLFVLGGNGPHAGADAIYNEVPFQLHGEHGVLTHLKYLLQTKGSAVVCVSEGAGKIC